MTSSNGNIFRVTGPLYGEFTGTGEFPAQSQWRGALMFSLICAWINDWVNNREAGDLRRRHGHSDVNVMNIKKAIRTLCVILWMRCNDACGDLPTGLINVRSTYRHIEGILPKGPYLPCVSMAGRALLAGYPRYELYITQLFIQEFVRAYNKENYKVTYDWPFVSGIRWIASQRVSNAANYTTPWRSKMW